MLRAFAYYPILGIPVLMYLGLTALTLFLTAATLGYLIYKGNINIPIRTHKLIAFSGITVALIHATLGILSYFGF